MTRAQFLNRRGFLRSAGVATLGLPLLESIGAGPLQAQTATTKRFLCFHCSSGVETDRFWPNIGAFGADSFAGRGVEPLQPYADRILIPRGVHGYPVGTWTGHLQGTGQALTAATISATEFAQGASIDQLIAKELNPGGREALVLRPGSRDLGVPMFNSISYRGPEQIVDPEADPFRAYRALVGDPTAAPPVAGDPVAEALLAKRKSVIDLVRADFAEVQALNLSTADREKLDAHFELIREVELSMSSPELVGCMLDAETVSQLEGLDPERVEANENFPAMARLHVKIAALALACGQNRSVVIQWGGSVAGSPMYQWDGMSHVYRHHPLSHGTTEDFNEVAVDGYKQMLFDIDRWNLSEFRKLLDILDGYTEADGTTLLDNTVALYTNEFSHGQGHTTGDLPFIVVGGAGYFKQGQSILIEGSTADIGGVEGANGNSNKMLATVLNAVGVPTPSFSTGPAGEFDELKA
jgi:Protein of unknown function (DUF1552)